MGGFLKETIIDGWVVRDWILGWVVYSLHVVAGLVGFMEARETSTIYYSTKVRVSDRVAEILILGR